MTNIKEKVLKGLDYEEYQDGLLYYRDSEGIRKSIAHINAFELLKAIDLTLAEVGKVNEDFISNLKESIAIQPEVMNFVQKDVLNQIIDKLAKELKQKLGIKN